MPQSETASIEQEVKFFLPNPEATRKLLSKPGIKPFQKKILETNLRLDAPDGRLTKQGIVLRLRSAGKCILTFKQPEGPITGPIKPDARRSFETEVIVDNIEKTAHVLEGLGFRTLVKYEKYREVYRHRSCLIMLDQLPFGFFLELEGLNLEELKESAMLLGLDWSKALQTSYMAIFLALKRQYKLSFLEATFQNFTGWDAQRTAGVLTTLPREALHDRKAF